MDLEVKGKVVLVTGGGQGVGRRLCIDFAQEGALVAVNDLFEERAFTVAQEIRNTGGRAFAVQADITDKESVDGMVDKIEQELGTIDILINNAGVIAERREKGGTPPLFHETTVAEWQSIIDLNIYGFLNCCHRVIPGMKAKKKGKIVNIMSEAGRAGQARLAVYAGAKAAQLGIAKSLAQELGKYSINVNAVSLGAVSHEGIKAGALAPSSTPENNDRLKKMLRAYPIAHGLERLATPADVSGMVLLLASVRGDFITGQSVGVSGGFTMI